MKLDGKYRVPLLLFVFYSLDMISSFMLDPTLAQYEMNPLARNYGWGYAAAMFLLFFCGLSYWWLWSGRNLKLIPKVKKWEGWFVATFSGKGAAKRWLVAFGRILPPASVAMKAVLVVNNLAFIVMVKVIGLPGMISLKNSLGFSKTPMYAFYIGIFVSMIVLMLIAGLLAARHMLGRLHRRQG